jgi:hypothetical protein
VDCNRENGVREERNVTGLQPKKFGNYSDALVARGFVVTCTKEEADKEQKMSYSCRRGHLRTIVYAAFGNLSGKVKKAEDEKECFPTFCSVCDTQDKITAELEGLGHILLAYRAINDVDYICGNCGEESHSNMGSLRRGTGVCNRCQNWTSRKSLDEVRALLSARGLTLLEPYTNNKVVRTIMCSRADA